MAGIKPNIYAVIVTLVGFLCLVISATAVGVPTWAYYEGRGMEDRGYFGPWRKCQVYGIRERCGDVGRFNPDAVVFVSGILAICGCIIFGIFCILSIIQIAMIASRDRVCMSYKSLVMLKLVAAVLAAGLSIAAAILFALQTDNARGYKITRGESFYLQILVTGLSLALLALAAYDRILTKRPEGDPTMLSNATANGRGAAGRTGSTYNNPGFRETSHNPNGIAVTDSSGRPYSSGMNGSMQSVNTTVTTVSNGSTIGSGSVTRTPLRSSLKKPRPPNSTTDGLGIRNPGYSGGNQSPRMQRNGSVKKVRIQTHSTDV
uniref:Uncharacterized protein n=1 Tax=Anopheles farauti TaxID=69004 RepID=A0A182QDN6_9DIPT